MTLEQLEQVGRISDEQREIERLELIERRGRPDGDDRWVARTVARLGPMHTIRPEGRPKKEAV